MIPLDKTSYDSVADFLLSVNKARRMNKDKWCFFVGNIAGKHVAFKAYNSYIQRLIVDNTDCTPAMDLSVKLFNVTLLKALS